MRRTVSILIGSGFAIPEGLPGVKELNSRLSKINENEILIHSDQRAIFLNGQVDPNRFLRWDERMFMQEFLEFYSSDVLKPSEQFHYETFYDYYSVYLHKKENATAIESFYEKFNIKYFKGSDDYRDCYNRISDFNRSYNQLLASLLHNTKYFSDEGCANYPPYDAFIGFIKEFLQYFDVKIHSLNHDLFLDFLGHQHSDLLTHFSDGYQLEGSPFYGKVTFEFNQKDPSQTVKKGYYVKLEHFVDKYDTALSLYKLHGSIFNTIVYTMGVKNQERIRIKDNYAVSEFVLEVKDPVTGQSTFNGLHDEVAPDFLSGTTNKMRFYTDDPYYVTLLQHFEENLTASELLFVIGYGFQDKGINEYLEKFFLSRGESMVVIDPGQPDTELLKKYTVNHIKKGVTDLSYSEYMTLIPDGFKTVL